MGEAILEFMELTTFTQETVAATVVDGTTWKDLLDKSTITKPTRICGFKLTTAGTWAGVAHMRIVTGDGLTVLWPFDGESVQDTDWTSAAQETLNFPVDVPIVDGYKVQFKSSDSGDGAGETLALTNLDIIETGY